MAASFRGLSFIICLNTFNRIFNKKLVPVCFPPELCVSRRVDAAELLPVGEPFVGICWNRWSGSLFWVDVLFTSAAIWHSYSPAAFRTQTEPPFRSPRWNIGLMFGGWGAEVEWPGFLGQDTEPHTVPGGLVSILHGECVCTWDNGIVTVKHFSC